MNEEKQFLNGRCVPQLKGKYTIYVNRNGVLKEWALTPLTKKLLGNSEVWYAFNDLPKELQEKYQDMTISAKDLILNLRKKQSKNNILDHENVSIYINGSTPILPIVGNLLPSDGMNAYTVIMENGKPKLKPIIICWGCHWSELFTGQTDYGMNVFCRADELTEEQKNRFIDDIIPLKDAPEFLGIKPNNGPNKQL